MKDYPPQPECSPIFRALLSNSWKGVDIHSLAPLPARKLAGALQLKKQSQLGSRVAAFEKLPGTKQMNLEARLEAREEVTNLSSKIISLNEMIKDRQA